MKNKQLEVIELGNPVLRKKAKEIKNINDPKLQKLIDDLVATLMKINGVGISAPQVNKSIRLFIVASHPNIRYPRAPLMKPTAIINPKILFTSKKKVKDWEGCLSIPGIRAKVPRSNLVKVEYIDRFGNKTRKTFTDFIARIFLHEYDHLEGKVFLDRVENNKDIVTEKEYQNLISKCANK